MTPDLSVEHGRSSILENRTWPIFDFRVSNMAYFRFSGVEKQCTFRDKKLTVLIRKTQNPVTAYSK